MTKVKICANKSIDEAKMSLDAGADIIGILVGQEHTSSDFVDMETAKKINDYVSNRCDVSLVTHLTQAEDIISLTKYIGNNTIQLHSDISESEVEKIKEALPDIKLVRLIHIATDGTICTDYKSMKYADYYLLDSFNLQTNQVGGTGLTHDWKKSGSLISTLDKPTFLAGGLNPTNVANAIHMAHPYGVDVNSGCKLDGKKNASKVKNFVKNAKTTFTPRKLVFDLDRTLLFVSPEWKDMYKSFLDKYNLNTTPEDLYACIGAFEKEYDDTLIDMDMMIDYMNKTLHITFTKEMFLDLLDLYKDIPLVYVEDTIYPLLEYLSKKYDLFAFTNWFTENQIDRLKNYNLDKFFSKVYGWDIVPLKASKRAIETIIGKDNKSDYIFIGDNMELDIILPDTMGIPTIYYNRKNIPQDRYTQILNISELKDIL